MAVTVYRMERIMGSCNSCGDCCSPVHIKGGITKNSLPADRHFAEQAFHEITNEEVLRRRPWLAVEYLREQGFVFYRCDFFNEETRQCMAYEMRPPVCRGFPWYNGSNPPNGRSLLTVPRCSYWEDVPPDERIEGIPVKFTPRDPNMLLH